MEYIFMNKLDYNTPKIHNQKLHKKKKKVRFHWQPEYIVYNGSYAEYNDEIT